MAGPQLIRSRDEAEAKLQVQIEKGQQLLNRGIETTSEIADLKSQYWAWREYNKALLESLFTAATIAKEYEQAFPSLVLLKPLPIDKEAALYKEYTRIDIKQLESILERLELYTVELPQSMNQSNDHAPERDVFICHAGEDKAAVVRPIAAAFGSAGISCWLDEAEILWADNITEKINEGLRNSRYVLVVFSASFMQKSWPQREFNAAMSQEAASGGVRVLPLLVGSKETQQAIIDKYPLIADKSYLVWTGDVSIVVEALQRRLGHKKGADQGSSELASAATNRGVYIPPIKRNWTQRDKDLFLEQSFSTVKSYFQEALNQLKAHYSEIDTDFSEPNNQTFLCKIYVQGATKNQCKVWFGDNVFTSSGIAYVEGRQAVGSDSAMNEVATVEEAPTGLAFSLLMSGVTSEKSRGLSPEELAESLWRRFTLPLT